jgi:hypothetical protein
LKNNFEIRGDVAVIFLRRVDGGTLECLIDAIDLSLVRSIEYSWYAVWAPTARTFYAVAQLPRPKRTRAIPSSTGSRLAIAFTSWRTANCAATPSLPALR